MIFSAPQLHNFHVAGINYKKSDAALRGEFALMPEAYVQLLQAAPQFGISECFVISTCNRTEIYGLAAEANQLSQLLCHFTSGSHHTFQLISYTHQGEAAAEHLFRVAAGLDSQILGDYEIVGQLKTAVGQAKKQGRLGAFSERLVNAVLQCGKAIRSKTQLSGGTVSVAFAAIQFLKSWLGFSANSKVAVVGLGKMGRNTCKNLIDYTGCRQITLLNRTAEKAAALALAMDLQYRSYDQLAEAVNDADVVIVSTAASEPVLLPDMVADGKPRLLIDLSVPNNISLETALLPGVELVNVDRLSQQKDATLQLRRAEVPKAEKLIDEHLEDFLTWVELRRHVPVLNAAKEKMISLQQCTGILNRGLNPMDPQGIQRIIKHMALDMQQQPEPGCNYLRALHQFVHQRTATNA